MMFLRLIGKFEAKAEVLLLRYNRTMNQEDIGIHLDQKRTSWQIFKAVHYALVMREVQTRFGSTKMGYFWALVDPMIMVLFFATIRTYLGTDSSSYDYAVFLATGMVPFNFFRMMMTQSTGAFEANRGLFVYKQVKPFDTIFARFGLEVFILLMVTLAFIFIGFYFGFDMKVKNINGVIFAEVWLLIFTFGISILFAVLGTFFNLIKKIVGFMSMPLFFISGLFFTAESLPPNIRELMLYNPLLHFIEMIHGNYFAALNTNFVDYRYMVLWTIVPFFAGIWLYSRAERRIVMT